MLNQKTSTQISKFLDVNLHRFDEPACYLGGEPNSFRWTDEQWDAAALKVLLTSPIDYMQAVANNTIPLLYRLSNEYNHSSRITERCYLPSCRRETSIIEKHGIPPWGLETRHCMSDYDVVAASISYAPYWVNAIKLLCMAGIPVRWQERVGMKEAYPLVMVGGQNTASPWFMAPVVDLVWCGEAEDEPGNPGFNVFLNELAGWKRDGAFYDAKGREQMLHELAVAFPWLFVPRFYELHHERKDAKSHPVLTGWTKKYPDLPDRIRKRIVKNLDGVSPLTKPPLPLFNPSRGTGAIQVSRGCTYRCGFCAATYREAPYRERSQQVAFDAYRENMKWTGAIAISPITLEFGTYSRKKALMRQCFEGLTDRFTQPALRVDVFGEDPVFGQLATHADRKHMALAIEGNSQRLREMAGKGIQEEDILKAYSNALAAGFKAVKVYMICNLPGETDEDHAELFELAKKLDDLRKSASCKLRTRFSWKPLTIEAWSPFQWFECRVRSADLASLMKRLLAIGFRGQLGDEATIGLGCYLQVAELADDIAGEALTDATIESNVTTYGSMPKGLYNMIIAALAIRGRTLDDYYRAKGYDELFAWDIIDPLISKDYLKRYHQRIVKRMAGEGQVYGRGFLEKFGSCAIGCAQCGACDEEQKVKMEEFALREDEPVQLADIKTVNVRTTKQKFLLTAEIAPDKRFVSQQFWSHALRRAANIAELKPTFNHNKFLTQRIKSMKRWFAGRDYFEMSFIEPLPGGGLVCTALKVESGTVLRELLNPELEPYGMTIIEAQEVPISGELDQDAIDGILWELEVDQPAKVLSQAVKKVMAAPYTELVYKIYLWEFYHSNPTAYRVNLADVLFDAFVVLDGRRAKLVMYLATNISPYDAANVIIGSRTDIYRYPAVARCALTTIESNDLSPRCKECGAQIPLELDRAFDSDYCIRHFYTKKLGWRQT